MTTNRYRADIFNRKLTIPKKKSLVVRENEQDFVTREELNNFYEKVTDSFKLIFEALDEHIEQSSQTSETLESLINAIEDLNTRLDKLQKSKK